MSIKGFNVNGVTEQYDYNYLDNKPEIHSIPTGGTAGQVLAKRSGADYAVEWADQTGVGGDITVDDVLSNTSENPVQNKVITAALATKADKLTEVTISTAGAVTQALDAGKIYHFTGALTALTITLNAPASGQLAQYHFDFNSGSTAATLTMPNTVTMPDSFTVEASKRYEVDVLNNYGTVVSWANS